MQKSNFFLFLSLPHPTTDQIISLILKMLKQELGWEPPSLENILERAKQLMDTELESDDDEVNKQDVFAMFNEEEEIDFEGFQDDEIELESLNEPNPLLDNNEIQSTDRLAS